MDSRTNKSTLRALLSNINVSRIRKSLSSLRRTTKSLRSLHQSSHDDSPQYLKLLPPEIWLLILRYATMPCVSLFPVLSCADPNEPVSFLSFPHSHSHLAQRLALYNASIKSKALLACVCKAWYPIAQEILFEFVWISRAKQAHALAIALQRQDGRDTEIYSPGTSSSPGRHIRRLHIETPVLERCFPDHLRIILDHAPCLTTYSDYRSIRRIPSFGRDPRSSPEQLLSALARPGNNLRRLSWTNYDYDREDYDGGIRFLIRVVSPKLETTAAHLQFLELNFCSSHIHSMGSGSISTLLSSSSHSLTTAALTSSNLTLPALRSLKVTLDNATFFVLSTWKMPMLQNLSVLSADFSYAGTGFAQFFLVHGPKITQLELGHSSGAIEEHYLTTPPSHAGFGGVGPIPLAEWCPNLCEFICSADAEWNWQSPDWIAPHVLLPTHPTLQFIGIRDMEKRMLDDLTLNAGRGRAYTGGGNEEDPFFMLFEQVASLLRTEAFPNLICVRDMSWGSDVMRRTGLVQPQRNGQQISDRAEVPASRRSRTDLGGILRGIADRSFRRLDAPSEAERESARTKGIWVLRFWRKVLEQCDQRDVCLEDYRGINITLQDLRRSSEGL